MKKLFPALLCLGLFIFIGCASTDIPNKNGVPLTTGNSVLVYGHYDKLSKLNLLVQSSDYKYELIECDVSRDYFVTKRPVYIDDKLKIMNYELEYKSLLGKTTAIEIINCGIGGYEMSFDKPQVYYFSFTGDYKKSEEKKAINHALKTYKNTEWAELLNKRLGELQ